MTDNQILVLRLLLFVMIGITLVANEFWVDVIAIVAVLFATAWLLSVAYDIYKAFKNIETSENTDD